MSQDETKLRQCVTNFLSNAFKFTKNGLVTLDVSSFEKDEVEMIEFKVTDDGEGMSQEGVSKVFEEYEQAERSTSATHQLTKNDTVSVSYTHLTLPTSDLV